MENPLNGERSDNMVFRVFGSGNANPHNIIIIKFG